MISSSRFQENFHLLVILNDNLPQKCSLTPCQLRFSKQKIIQPRLKSKNLVQPNIHRELLTVHRSNQAAQALALVLPSALTTFVIEKTEEKMNCEKPAENKQVKINKAVSFNAIKKMAFDIFFNEKNKNLVLEKLDKLFRMNPVVIYSGPGCLDH